MLGDIHMEGKVLTIKSSEDLTKIMKALSTQSRVDIMELLNDSEMNLNEISKKLNMPAPSVTVNILKLEEAGLIEAEYISGERGSQKICRRNFDNLFIEFPGSKITSDNHYIEMSMPIGNYKDFDVSPPCGIASENGIIGLLDDVQAFLEPEHVYAKLIWFKEGYLRYRFPNNIPANANAKNLVLSMEICSEYPKYNEDWPSDITVWINDVEIGTWTSPGDMGDTRGKLNPEWWNSDQTQYGFFKIWTVNKKGSYIDGKSISDCIIEDLKIDDNKFIDFKIGIKDDVRNIGGINLFGSTFGNYDQDLVLRLGYEY